MHINFQTETQPTVKENSVNVQNIRMSKAYGADGRAEKAASGVLMDIGEGKNATHGFKGLSGKAKGREDKNELLDGVDSFDAKNAHNYMAVMSNTMSDRDFQAMKEEGFHPGRMSEGEAVTGLDRIKVVLAKSGVSVAGFTDTLDRATVAEITGSVSEANAIMNDTPVDSRLTENEGVLRDFVAEGLKEADLPVTEENIKDAVNAFNTAAITEPMDQGSMEFMLSNEEEPTIENVYMAEHSGSGSGSGGASGYFNNEGTPYYSEIAGTDDLQALSGQIDTIIENAGLKVDEETRKDAEYLIKSGFALNSETLNLYKDLKEISFPLKAGDLMAEISEAIARGESAGNAYLIKGYNRIKNERILNETRLQMNIEANRSIDSDNGFVLETGELSDKVDELRAKERAFFRTAFMKDGAEGTFSLEESIDLAEETLFKVSAIKEMPAALSGTFASAEDFTVNDVYEAGKDLKERFDAANMTYEAVGTSVRPDLGDRIGNAFRNAGELLHELGIKETEENLRAVRILGYNSMEITGENIADVKAADQTVRTLINRLTGSAAVSLIREGVNPLETGMQELIEKISDMQGLEGENEKFSEYLFKLERNNGITEDEATSYIGIFRLLRQIENSDGAVIGSLVNSGRELSLKNLLTELRVRGKGHIDFSIDKDFGGVTAAEEASLDLKIDTQIETAFRNESDTDSKRQQQYAENLARELYDSISPEKLPEIEKLEGSSTLEDILDIVRKNGEKTDKGVEELFYAEEAEVVREAAEKEDKVYEMLLRYGQEITAENVNAMDFLMNERGAFFNELVNVLGESYLNSLKTRSDKILEKMGEDEEGSEEDKAEAVGEEYSEMAEETEKLIKDASENAGRYVDLKALQNLNRRLTVAKALSNEENYEIPMEINGHLTSVNVKFIRGTGESKAAVSFDTEETGQVYGEFTYTAGEVSGYAVSSTDNGERMLKNMSERFFESLDNAGIRRGNIIFEKTLTPDINRIPETADNNGINYSVTRNETLSGTDRDEQNASMSKDAAKSPAILYRTVRMFLQEVSYADQQ